jgi:glycosyltransferase involved in cell wall biosynthesis
MSNLKVLFVIEGMGTGGTERSVAELLPYLKTAGILPIVVCFHHREGVEQELIRQGFDLRFLSGKNTRQWFQQLRRILKSERPDVIHTALFRSDLVGRLAAIGTTIPVISSLVSTPYRPIRFRDPHVNKRTLRMMQLLDAATGRLFTSHFHAVSHAAKAAAIADIHLPAQRITVIQRGRNAKRLGEPSQARRQQARQALNLAPEAKVLVNLGRHEYAKGQHHILEAMAQLRDCHPEMVLLLAGRTGLATPKLEHLCTQAGLSGQVRFLGYREDIPDILAAADLFVFPSLYEGLPGAVLEAMALGLPIVAFDIPPVREVVAVNENALLVETGSTVQFTAAIQTLLADRALADRFSQCSRAIFLERYTLEKSAAQMVDLYTHVADSKATR